MFTNLINCPFKCGDIIWESNRIDPGDLLDQRWDYSTSYFIPRFSRKKVEFNKTMTMTYEIKMIDKLNGLMYIRYAKCDQDYYRDTIVKYYEWQNWSKIPNKWKVNYK